MDIDYSPTGREFVTGSYDRTVSFLLSHYDTLCSETHLLISLAHCRLEYFNIMVVTAEKYTILRECKGQLKFDACYMVMCLKAAIFEVLPLTTLNLISL